jgi:hypothetical protein
MLDAMLPPTDESFAHEAPEPDPLATRPVYMEDNAMPHRSRSATAYLQSEAVTSVPWPAMSPYLNLIEHIWDILGRRIQVREPHVQNFRQLEEALHRA